MQTLTLFSEKGGVGKTTVTLHLGLALAERGWRVLVLDTDPAGGIGASVGRPEAPGFWDVVCHRCDPESVILATANDRLKLITAGEVSFPELAALEAGGTLAARLAGLLEPWRGRFDVVLIDTPSGVRGVTAAALEATAAALLLVQSEPLALRTAARSLEALAAVNRHPQHLQHQPAARLAGVLFTMTALRVRESLDVMQEAWSLFPGSLVLDTHVPRDVEILTAQAATVPLGFLTRRRSPLSSVFDNLAGELEPRLGLATEGPSGTPRPFFV